MGLAQRTSALCRSILALGSLASLALLPAAAQVARLDPAGPPVEIVDPSERISGNATVGAVLLNSGATIGSDRLWAYLSPPIAPKLKLRISSIDGRYYAEVEYDTAKAAPGWVALNLSLREFAFLEKNYTNHLNEVAALLGDADGPHVYPVSWGPPHRGTATPPNTPADDDPLRIYLNTERATAFLVVDSSPSYCTDASTVSAFKFNAICEVRLGALRTASQDATSRVVEGLEIQRRSGTRRLEPVQLDVLVQY